MRSLYIFTILLLLNFNNLSAQERIISGLLEPADAIIKGNDLYVSEVDTGNILKIDLNSTDPTVDVLFTLNLPDGLAFKGDFLYIALRNGVIARSDLSEASPTVQSVINGLTGASGLAFHGDDLYISQTYDNAIIKIDTSLPTPTVINVLSDLDRPKGMQIEGDFLYFGEKGDDKISKIDLTIATPTIIEVAAGGGQGLLIDGNSLYSSAGTSTNQVYRTNDFTTTTPSTSSLLIDDLVDPYGLAIHDGFLYIVEHLGYITKVELSTLSINDNILNKKLVKIYPNPSNRFISIEGLLTKGNYSIYNSLGTTVNTGIINNNKQIDIQDLSKGLYFLKFENGSTIKFAKK